MERGQLLLWMDASSHASTEQRMISTLPVWWSCGHVFYIVIRTICSNCCEPQDEKRRTTAAGQEERRKKKGGSISHITEEE